MHALAFSSDGRYLAVGVGERPKPPRVHMWVLDDGMKIEQKEELRAEPECIVFHPDGGSFVLGDGAGFAYRIRARMWRKRDFVSLADGSLPAAQFAEGRAHSHKVTGAAYFRGGERVLTVSGGKKVLDNDVAVWDALTGKLLGRALRGSTRYGSVDISPDGRRLLLSDLNNDRAEVWSMAVVRVP